MAAAHVTRVPRKSLRRGHLHDASLGVGSLVPRSVGIGSKAERAEVEIVCSSDPMPHIMPQITEARCHGYEGPTFWRRYKAWRLRLDFHLLDEEVTLSCWFNLGQGDKPKVGRGSKYRQAWILANDGEVPRREDRLSPGVFIDKIFKVKVRDAGTSEKYSVVDSILERTGP